MNYAGITVGPVTGTLSLTSTPAGLWAASYFFSSFVRSLCMALQEEGATVLTVPEDFVVKEHLEEYKGVGRYHDRVYFMMDKEAQEVRAQLLGARDTALKSSASDLGAAVGQSAGEAETFLRKYIHFHYVIVDDAETKEKGLAKTLADALDSLELAERAQARQEKNLFLTFLRADKNEYVRNFPPLTEATDAGGFALARRMGNDIALMDLPRIARGELIPEGSEKAAWGKTDSYFAIVQADGDNMGQLFSSVCGESETECIRLFSKLCMDFTADAAEKVRAFGGAMIYAGGDDLLFLAPVIGAEGRTVWELCREIDDSFKASFAASPFSKRELPTPPSISFGVSVNYVKFPLYEAFKNAQKLLFGTAKRAFNDKERKNNLAVQVLKHSGQASGFLVSLKSESLDKFIALLNEFFKKDGKSADKANQTMHSVLYHIENQKAAFAAAMADDNAKDTIRNAFVNAFDNAGQILGREQNEAVANLAAAITAD